MATKVLKRIVTEYLKRFAEPRIKELTGLELYTVEGATEEFVILHSIKRGLFFDCNNEISFTPAVQEVPFSYFYAEYEILTRDRLLELTNTKSPFEEAENE